MRSFKNYKIVLSIAGVMLAAIGIVAILSWSSKDLTFENNGFTRRIERPELKMNSAIVKDDGVIQICGLTNDRLFFKTKIPGKIFETNYELKNEKYLTFNVPTDTKIVSSFSCFTDGKRLSLLSGNLPGEFIARSGEQTRVNKFKSPIFTRIAKISENTYIFRGFKQELKTIDQIFLKFNTETGVLSRENNISKQNNDGGLATDGLLHYDDKTNLLVYVMYYTNQFQVLDTNLNLIYAGNTIDTLSTYQVEGGLVANSKQTSTLTNLTPKKVINASNCISNGKLYNYSTLKAENETNQEFGNNSVIDVYDLKTGKYERSFYIPTYENERVKNFKVIDNRLIAIYKNHIASYTIHLSGSTGLLNK